jgi:TonB family protein
LLAVEFILGEKHAANNAASDSTAVKYESIYADSAENANYQGIRGQIIIGERSRASIMRGIDQNSNTIRKEYNNYIRQGNKLGGSVIVRFKINSKGEVFECKIVQGNLNDFVFEKNIVLTVKRWKFPETQDKNDTTIVEYPFVFGQY